MHIECLKIYLIALESALKASTGLTSAPCLGENLIRYLMKSGWVKWFYNKQGYLKVFPILTKNANEAHLLSLWTGLGYYNRARNLQKGAQQVMKNHNGELPKSSGDLIKIAGIGPYTAAAISSICHGEKIGVVDGNVFRVLSRFFGISTPVNTTAGLKEFQLLANDLLHISTKGSWSLALCTARLKNPYACCVNWQIFARLTIREKWMRFRWKRRPPSAHPKWYTLPWSSKKRALP